MAQFIWDVFCSPFTVNYNAAFKRSKLLLITFETSRGKDHLKIDLQIINSLNDDQGFPIRAWNWIEAVKPIFNVGFHELGFLGLCIYN